MTNQEILTKVIQKAIDGGWAYWLHEGFAKFKVWEPVDMLEPLVQFELGDVTQEVNYQHVIFNRDFAKALWGEQTDAVKHYHIAIFDFPGYIDTTHPLHSSADIRMVQEHDMKCLECGKVLSSKWELNHTVCWFEGGYEAGWERHLQKMVVSEDPIKYLANNI